ncbi:hypothetical protein FF38_09052 [Lucilia cuprina]|uniref:Uncharacterized protein n=1 Tax=Lucilia cuprina TaxID=7375 RepID=A0A0L0CR46_LUCCU|nr:hypothetical protein FF38_09052 [Lucilia cuprina]
MNSTSAFVEQRNDMFPQWSIKNSIKLVQAEIDQYAEIAFTNGVDVSEEVSILFETLIQLQTQLAAYPEVEEFGAEKDQDGLEVTKSDGNTDPTPLLPQDCTTKSTVGKLFDNWYIDICIQEIEDEIDSHEQLAFSSGVNVSEQVSKLVETLLILRKQRDALKEFTPQPVEQEAVVGTLDVATDASDCFHPIDTLSTLLTSTTPEVKPATKVASIGEIIRNLLPLSYEGHSSSGRDRFECKAGRDEEDKPERFSLPLVYLFRPRTVSDRVEDLEYLNYDMQNNHTPLLAISLGERIPLVVLYCESTPVLWPIDEASHTGFRVPNQASQSTVCTNIPKYAFFLLIDGETVQKGACPRYSMRTLLSMVTERYPPAFGLETTPPVSSLKLNKYVIGKASFGFMGQRAGGSQKSTPLDFKCPTRSSYQFPYLYVPPLNPFLPLHWPHHPQECADQAEDSLKAEDLKCGQPPMNSSSALTIITMTTLKVEMST